MTSQTNERVDNDILFVLHIAAVINDETKDAFRITSDGIGKDWIWLYQTLPFNPPRDTKQRERDVESKWYLFLTPVS